MNRSDFFLSHNGVNNSHRIPATLYNLCHITANVGATRTRGEPIIRREAW